MKTTKMVDGPDFTRLIAYCLNSGKAVTVCPRCRWATVDGWEQHLFMLCPACDHFGLDIVEAGPKSLMARERSPVTEA